LRRFKWLTHGEILDFLEGHPLAIQVLVPMRLQGMGRNGWM
jgi:hypothetical protein